MIARLSGKVLELSEKYVILDVNGVGYKVYCPKDTISGLFLAEHASLHTYLSVREDALDLYGFDSEKEKIFFEMLISVSGIGPKSAIGILSTESTEALSHSISNGNIAYLTKVSGIGRKTAEKIILELRDKVGNYIGTKETSDSIRAETDVIEALKSLGYSQNEARNALKEIPDTIIGANARIKEALKILNKK